MLRMKEKNLIRNHFHYNSFLNKALFLLQGPRSDLPSHHNSSMAYHLQICSMQAQNTQAAMTKLSEQHSMLTEKCSSLESNFKHLQELVENSLASGSHLKKNTKSAVHGEKYSGSSELPADCTSPAPQLAEITTAQEKRLVAVER